MKTYANKLIYTGWVLYIISLIVPWSGRPFGGWLSGWFWQGISFFPFYRLVTFQEAKIGYIGAYTLSLSIIIMFASPILLILANRRASKYYVYLVEAGFVLAISSFFGMFVYFEPIPSPILLFVFGYCIYVGAFGVLSLGFARQISCLTRRDGLT